MKPMDGGKCFGGVVVFLENAMKSNVQTAADNFKQGMPISASIYQSVYNEFYTSPINLTMYEFLISVIDHKNCSEETYNSWNQQFGEETLPILKAIQAYIKEVPDNTTIQQYMKNNCLKREKGFLDYVKTKIFTEYNKNLGDFYALVRDVEEHYVGKNLHAFDEDQFLFAFRGLEIEPICLDDSPGEIITSLSNLDPGCYCLNFTVYNPIGGVAGSHSTGFVINDNETFHFLDPTFAVGEFKIEELQETISRVFKQYTGFRFDRDSKSQTNFDRLWNFIQLNPNASSKVSSGCYLYQVKAANP
ncbi:MAG: hypothetical protein JJU12_01260 [Chlamydiales bacterium]|nr:hypothetical protein [Chlamydiales bacterium]